jgi:hypothetical protein
MTLRRTFSALILAGALAGLTTAPVHADDFDHDHDRHRHEHEYRPHVAPGPWWHDDIHRFHDHDFGVWRTGRWYHGPHAGRAGWWWIVGGVWYFYPAPVYPYPDPYVPPTVVAPQMYYWCSNPPGYYPQVPACPVPWQAVPGNAPPPQ